MATYTTMVTTNYVRVLFPLGNRRLCAPLSFPEASQRLHSWPRLCLGGKKHAVWIIMRLLPPSVPRALARQPAAGSHGAF